MHVISCDTCSHMFEWMTHEQSGASELAMHERYGEHDKILEFFASNFLTISSTCFNMDQKDKDKGA